MSLTPVQQAVLVDLCVFRDDKAENIAHRTGYHRNTVSKYMKSLVNEGYISAKGGGNYRLTDKGLETAQGLIRAGELPYGNK